jgi:hypothetical protein
MTDSAEELRSPALSFGQRQGTAKNPPTPAKEALGKGKGPAQGELRTAVLHGNANVLHVGKSPH